MKFSSTRQRKAVMAMLKIKLCNLKAKPQTQFKSADDVLKRKGYTDEELSNMNFRR